MQNSIRHSIAIKQAKTAALAAVIVGILFSVAQLTYDLLQERESNRQAAYQVLNSMKDPASEAAYNLSVELANKVLNGVFENRIINQGSLYAIFSSGERELLAQRKRESATDEVPSILATLLKADQAYNLQLTDSATGLASGILEVQLDPNVIAEIFIDRVMVVFTAGLARNIALTFILVFAFYQTLTKPITRLAKRINGIKTDNPEAHLIPVPKKNENDEIGLLITGINGFLTAIGENLDQRKRAEKKVQDTMQLFQALARSGSDMFWQSDKHGTLALLYADEKVDLIDKGLGLTGSNFFELLKENCSPEELTQVEDIETNQEDFRGIRTYFSLNERPLILSFYGSANFDDTGNFTGYLGTVVDVTHIVEKDQEIAAAKDKLRQSQKMEAVGQLTGGIAHDFNNLLAVIVGNIEIVCDELDDHPDLQKFLQKAIDSGEKGAKLTQQLLSFSRKQDLNPAEISVNEVIENLADLLGRTIGGEITIETQFASNLYDGFIDATQFENAIINLAINARDAMPNGGTLSINTANITISKPIATENGIIKPGSYVKVTVSDTGHGMPEDTLHKAMEPFFTTKEVGKGSGMGLAMVFGFISQSSGYMTIESQVDIGTKIELFLPAVISKKQETQDSHTVLRASGE